MKQYINDVFMNVNELINDIFVQGLLKTFMELFIGLKNINLSIDIPVAWEYEPVLIKTLYSDDKIDLRAHIENNMVDHGLDYNDKLSAEFVNEVLDDEFFGQMTKSMLLKKVFY